MKQKELSYGSFEELVEQANESAKELPDDILFDIRLKNVCLNICYGLSLEKCLGIFREIKLAIPKKVFRELDVSLDDLQSWEDVIKRLTGAALKKEVELRVRKL